MKMIEAVIPSDALDDVRALLWGRGIWDFVACDILVTTVDDSFETIPQYSESLVAAFLPEVKLEVAVPDERATATAQAILHAASERGPKPQVEIIITCLEEVVRIETGQRGAAAI